MLSELSPFLDDILDSAAVPSSPHKAKRPRTEVEVSDFDVATALDDEMDEDSDAETDDYLVEKKETPLYGVDEVRGDFSYRQLTLRGVSYTTFLAVLQWLQSGRLEFAELKSETAAQNAYSSAVPPVAGRSLGAPLARVAQVDVPLGALAPPGRPQSGGAPFPRGEPHRRGRRV